MQDRDTDKEQNEKYTQFSYYKIDNEIDRDNKRMIHGDIEKEQSKGDDRQ